MVDDDAVDLIGDVLKRIDDPLQMLVDLALDDEPERVGGTDTGPQPTDLLLSAVASCFVLSLAYAAAKRDVAIERIDVDVTGRYEGPRFASIRIEVDVDAPDDVLATLISAAERVCYVTNTLKRPPEITVVTRSSD